MARLSEPPPSPGHCPRPPAPVPRPLSSGTPAPASTYAQNPSPPPTQPAGSWSRPARQLHCQQPTGPHKQNSLAIDTYSAVLLVVFALSPVQCLFTFYQPGHSLPDRRSFEHCNLFVVHYNNPSVGNAQFEGLRKLPQPEL